MNNNNYKAQHTYYQNNKEKVKNHNKLMRNKRRDAGICRYCDNKVVTKCFCQEHRKLHSLKAIQRIYGITIDEYESLGNKCMICGTNKTTTERLHVDHNHTTGKVRGILCNNCNNGLGRFKDDIALLKKAIRYLEDI